MPRADWLATLEAYADDLTRAMQRRLSEAGQTLDWLSQRLASPVTTIAHERLNLQSLQARLLHATRILLRQSCFALVNLCTRLSAQTPNTATQRHQLLE